MLIDIAKGLTIKMKLVKRPASFKIRSIRSNIKIAVIRKNGLSSQTLKRENEEKPFFR
ncbi:hypothetical protein STRMA_1112 [Streptococcus macacae NCTC 11558]|uniref:Uncharacterized protein n=1 Tax=Streptococcus macacae NCTC 11558 TaxID=764298 RepID=G5JVU4_9STRE|nr:hypothetical protein STRMA_1112 [Streptococcus macacae NCTC 11558]